MAYVKMELELDLKDRKILFELEQDARQSLQQLARKVGLKKETVFHRIKNLEKNGIIKNYLTEINIYKLGYQYYPMLLRFTDTTPQREREIFEYLRKSRYVAWLTKCEGAWDVNLTLVEKSNLEINKFMTEFLEKYGKYIAEKQVFITTEIHYFKRGFSLGKKTMQIVTTGGKDLVEIDKNSLELLKILSGNARKSLVDIARELKMNARNVAYLIKKLERQNVIQGSRILVDFSKRGFKFYKVFFSLKDLDAKNFNALFSYLRDQPNIIWATKFIGSYDLSIEMEVKDVGEFRGILDKIKGQFSHLIKKHESLLIFEESVMNYLP